MESIDDLYQAYCDDDTRSRQRLLEVTLDPYTQERLRTAAIALNREEFGQRLAEMSGIDRTTLVRELTTGWDVMQLIKGVN